MFLILVVRDLRFATHILNAISSRGKFATVGRINNTSITETLIKSTKLMFDTPCKGNIFGYVY